MKKIAKIISDNDILVDVEFTDGITTWGASLTQNEYKAQLLREKLLDMVSPQSVAEAAKWIEEIEEMAWKRGEEAGIS